MVRKGVGADARIGKRFLFPGIGYGGSCFPKDVKALAKTAKDAGYDMRILNSVMQVNERQRLTLIRKLDEFYGGDFSGKKIGIWGIAFKPNTDDIREAPSLFVIQELLNRGCRVCVYDPEAMNNLKRIFGDKISYCDDMYSCLNGIDALLILTEWSLFRTVDFEKMGGLMKEKVIFDGRNLYNLEQAQEHGFYYNSIGRKTVIPKNAKTQTTR
jgi:UDPglucose 6-dehydrogenase